MSFFDIIKLAFINLNRNKMRTFLTALSVVISIASVVAIVALGQGAYSYVQEEMAKFAHNLMIVRGGKAFKRGVHKGYIYSLTIADLDAIVRECTNPILISPNVSKTSQVVYKNKNMNVYCSGITKDYLKIFSWEIIEGRNFTPSDISTHFKICIIGSSVAKKNFKDTNPIEALRYE